MDPRLFDVPAASREPIARALGASLGAEADVAFAYLHGSFAADLPFHDIDVAVFLTAPHMTSRILDVADRLSRLVGYPVDVRSLTDAPLAFQFRALHGDLLVVRDEELLANFMERVGRLYLDIAPVLKRASREAFAR